jgi:hypothetical protein
MPPPALEPNEREIATYRANRTQGSRAIGGHLLLTDRRVVFYPHKVDSATGARNWESALESISDVSMSDRGRNPLNGSLRRRLKISCRDVNEHFVVSNGAAIVEAIQQAISRYAQ